MIIYKIKTPLIPKKAQEAVIAAVPLSFIARIPFDAPGRTFSPQQLFGVPAYAPSSLKVCL